MSRDRDQQMTTREPAGKLSRIEPVRSLEAPMYRISELVSRIEQMKEVAIVCCPFTSLDHIPPNFAVSERIVLLDVEEGAGDTYHSPLYCKDNERALAKNGLLKIWLAAGGSVLMSERVDDRKDPRYVEWSTMLELRQIDGNIVKYPGSRTIDLRPNSDQITASMSKGQTAGARQNIDALAESKAILRAIRGIMGLKQTYRTQDLKTKPFVTYTLVPNFDMSDPEIKRMVVASMLGPDMYRQVRAEIAAAGETGEPGHVVDGSRMPDEDGKPQAPAGSTTKAGTPSPQNPMSLNDIRRAREAAAPPADDAPPADENVNSLKCGCPCGCPEELSEKVAAASVEKVGSMRCPPCYPGYEFDISRHERIKNLGLAKFPQYTPEDALNRRRELRNEV